MARLNRQELRLELLEHREALQALFDMAWNQNMSDRGTELSRMVTSEAPGIIQTLSAIIERIPAVKKEAHSTFCTTPDITFDTGLPTKQLWEETVALKRKVGVNCWADGASWGEMDSDKKAQCYTEVPDNVRLIEIYPCTYPADREYPFIGFRPVVTGTSRKSSAAISRLGEGDTTSVCSLYLDGKPVSKDVLLSPIDWKAVGRPHVAIGPMAEDSRTWLDMVRVGDRLISKKNLLVNISREELAGFGFC